MSQSDLIIGAGMTGLAAGMSSGLPVYEAEAIPGGICSSYYLKPGESEPLGESATAADLDQAYRFEIGGGHWIFGGDPTVLSLIERLVDVVRYERRSSVFFPETGKYVPYPLQNNLRHLDAELAAVAIDEMARPKGSTATMQQWLTEYFGPTLSALFFEPFHELYTAGLHTRIAPQDAYKSPVDIGMAVRGALLDAPPVGYNTTFLYPGQGLDALARKMAESCDVRYGKRVVGIDGGKRRVSFADGSHAEYRSVLSTLPLNVAADLAGISTRAPADPHSSVLVLNIGGVRGPRCPDDHWLYIPRSDSGFHRVGFYSNVDASFMPRESRATQSRVSIYVEKAFQAGQAPSPEEVSRYGDAVAAELIRWGYISSAEVVHPTWIEVAYTWSWPGSSWRSEAMSALQRMGIYQIGRYGRWNFQGIADSIRDGFVAGNSFGSAGGKA
ncbi:MAG: protoporphyrinogen/coproporphyrinogen oxidase [Pseudomonadales bacterium]